jgi:hypothetical protein
MQSGKVTGPSEVQATKGLDDSGMSATMLKRGDSQQKVDGKKQDSAPKKAFNAVVDDIGSSFKGIGTSLVSGGKLAKGIMQHYWTGGEATGPKTDHLGKAMAKDWTEANWETSLTSASSAKNAIQNKLGKGSLSMTSSIVSIGSDMKKYCSKIDEGMGKIDKAMPTSAIGRFFAKAGLVIAAAVGFVATGIVSVIGRVAQAAIKGVTKLALSIPIISPLVVNIGQAVFALTKNIVRVIGPPIVALGALVGGLVLAAKDLAMGIAKAVTFGGITATKAGITHLKTGETAKSINDINKKLDDMGIKVEIPKEDLTVLQKCRKVWNIATTDVWGLKKVDDVRAHASKVVTAASHTNKLVGEVTITAKTSANLAEKATTIQATTTALTVTSSIAVGSGVMTVADGGMKVGKAVYRLYSGEALKEKINTFIEPEKGAEKLKARLKEINEGTTFSKGIKEYDKAISDLVAESEKLKNADPNKHKDEIARIGAKVGDLKIEREILTAQKVDCENTLKVISPMRDPVKATKMNDEKLKVLNEGTTFSKGITQLDKLIGDLEKERGSLMTVTDRDRISDINDKIKSLTKERAPLLAQKAELEADNLVLKTQPSGGGLDDKTKASLKQLSSRIGTSTNIATLLEGSALMVGGMASTVGSIAAIATGTTTTLLAAGAALTVGALSASGFGLAIVGAGMLIGAGVTAYKVDKVLEREAKIAESKGQLTAVDTAIKKVEDKARANPMSISMEDINSLKELKGLKQQIEVNLCRLDPETASKHLSSGNIKLPEVVDLQERPEIRPVDLMEPLPKGPKPTTRDVLALHIFGKTEVTARDFPKYTGLVPPEIDTSDKRYERPSIDMNLLSV